jgi:hypothetical protein
MTEKALLATDKYDKDSGRYLQQCGCQYVYVTDKSGHQAVLWQDYCKAHWDSGRR